MEMDPIYRSVEALQCGNPDQAYAILMELLQQDLRCLDAHAHLGNLFFDGPTDLALRHYTVGTRSASSPSGMRSTACCSGGSWTTARTCAACTAAGSPYGAWNNRRKPPPCSSGCCGSTRMTTKAPASASNQSGRGRSGSVMMGFD